LGSGVAFITPTDISDGSIYADIQRRLSAAGESEFASIMLPTDAICYTCIASIGKMCLTNEPSITNQQINSIIVDSTKCSPRWLFYALKAERERIRSLASGAATPIINKTIFSNIQIGIPELNQQRRIASILGGYDDLIEINRRRIASLEEMTRRLFEEWFVHFRFPDHEDKITTRGDDGVAPLDWKVSPLSSLVDASYGYTATSQMQPVGPKLLRVMDINKSFWIDWQAVPYCLFDGKDRSRFALQPNDLVVARMADTGKVGFVDREIDAIAASYLVRLRPHSLEDAMFIFHLLTHRKYQDYVAGASTGATRKSAGIPVLTGFRFPCPPPNLRGRFSQAVSPLRSLGTKLVQTNSYLSSARDLLLPRLISGELSVITAEREPEAAE
jgi:type I restriction enzyme S subunit